MSSICVVTDSSVQYSRQTFPGKDKVFQVPLPISYNGMRIESDPQFKVTTFPARLTSDHKISIASPSYQDWLDAFANLSQTYNEIIAITMSSNLAEVFQNLEKAARNYRGKTSITVVDSHTTSVGLGALVQNAAAGIKCGQSLSLIEQNVRGLIPSIYTQITTSNLSYLHESGYITEPQAVLGEAISILPVFSLEEGRLMATNKVKNYHHLMDISHEFIDEFSELDQVAIIQGQPPSLDTHTLREYVTSNFSGVLFTELPLNLVHASLFGPSSVSIFAIEK